jgi:hypothetical protein
MTPAMTDVLLSENDTLVTELGENATDEHILTALVAAHDWTEEGARAILSLARTYGTAIPRNALALACAMDIEDGEAGL